MPFCDHLRVTRVQGHSPSANTRPAPARMLAGASIRSRAVAAGAGAGV